MPLSEKVGPSPPGFDAPDIWKFARILKILIKSSPNKATLLLDKVSIQVAYFSVVRTSWQNCATLLGNIAVLALCCFSSAALSVPPRVQFFHEFHSLH